MGRLRYLLDTNILSALIKEPAGELARRIDRMEGDEFCTSIVVACEMRYGAAKKGSARLEAIVDQTLSQIDVLPLEAEADRHYAALRVALEEPGQPIGPNDLFIAAHARSLGLTLVTGNTREFSRVPGLVVENWLEPEGGRH
ncbi:MAG TPA: type II toxin-antitoxin system VapC family toxin [Thermoanaerobaculia bacterium]|nr:type II toxin-antitoxin system VapC family toxin [Thermoanaerobaculia bacterium]